LRILDFFYAVQSLPTSHPILYAVPTLPTYSMTCVSCSLEWLRSRETSQSIRILINFHFFKEHFVELGSNPDKTRFLLFSATAIFLFFYLQQQNKFRCYKMCRSYRTLMLLARASRSCIFYYSIASLVHSTFICGNFSLNF
jgi:hypothetical protein